MSGSLGKRILVAATAVVVVSVIAGIVIIGSPTERGLQQLDTGRISDLREIMAASDFFWSRNERLPSTLEELAEDPRSSVNIIDPGSAEPYGYRILDEDTYELCAIFDRASAEVPSRSVEDYWRHATGRQCFELEVDKTRR